MILHKSYWICMVWGCGKTMSELEVAVNDFKNAVKEIILPYAEKLDNWLRRLGF